jgi:hypothetical protein
MLEIRNVKRSREMSNGKRRMKIVCETSYDGLVNKSWSMCAAVR